MSGSGAEVVKTLRSYAGCGAIIQAALLLTACGDAANDVLVSNQSAASASETQVKTVSIPISGPKRTVLAFGDSLYAGYGLKRGESLPDAVQAQLRSHGIDAEIVNAGVSSDTTAGGRRRLAYTLDRLETAPDLVLLGLGGNDVLRQVNPTETRANLAAMLDELEKREIPVVLTGMLAPPNLGPEFAARFNAIWPDLARKHEAALYPFILEGVIGNRALILQDGVHPNAQGVSIIAQRLAPVVERRLKQLGSAR